MDWEELFFTSYRSQYFEVKGKNYKMEMINDVKNKLKAILGWTWISFVFLNSLIDALS
jgi:hypothetical protein